MHHYHYPFRRLCIAFLLFCATLVSRAQPYPGTPVTWWGGTYISHPQIFTIFLGKEWLTDPNLITERAQLNQFLGYLVQSAFMDGLNQYNIFRGSYIGSIVDPITSPQFIYDGDFQNILVALNSARQLPVSSAVVYFIFPSPTSYVQAPYPAYHLGFSYSDQFFNFNTFNYAIIGQYVNTPVPNARNQFDVLTALASHELAEICTDPMIWDSNYGWLGSQEVCDLVAPTDGFLGGYLVSAYYSNRQHGPIISPPPIPTKTAAKVSKGAIHLGAPLTVTVTIKPKTFSANALTGLVDLFDNGTNIGEVFIPNSGPLIPQTFVLNNLSAGKHHIRAVYSGGNGYAGSQSPARIVNVK